MQLDNTSEGMSVRINRVDFLTKLREELTKNGICSETVTAKTPKQEREDIVNYFKT